MYHKLGIKSLQPSNRRQNAVAEIPGIERQGGPRTPGTPDSGRRRCQGRQGHQGRQGRQAHQGRQGRWARQRCRGRRAVSCIPLTRSS